MVRTRDLVLVLVVIVFLVLAISVTTLQNQFSSSSADQSVFTKEILPPETVAIVPEVPDERAARLAKWREQLRDFRPTPTPEEVITAQPDNEENKEDTIDTIAMIKRCSLFRPYTTQLPRLYLQEQEGVRLITTVPAAEEITSDTVVAVLPSQHIQPGTVTNCLSTDVVGIALDGSLIRMDMHGAYGIFGTQSLIGYALDGYPIFGNHSNAELDVCGGIMTPSGYQYHVSLERESVLQCFRGTAVTLP